MSDKTILLYLNSGMYNNVSIINRLTDHAQKMELNIERISGKLALKHLYTSGDYKKYDGFLCSVPVFTEAEEQRYWCKIQARRPSVNIALQSLYTESNYVGIDDNRAIYDLCSHLEENGYLSPGFLNVAYAAWTIPRFRAYNNYCREHEKSVSSETVFGFDPVSGEITCPNNATLSEWYATPVGLRYEIESKEIEQFIINNAHIDSVICASDIMAVRLFNICLKHNLKIPADIAICGFDHNQKISAFMKNNYQCEFITSIENPVEKILFTALGMLYDILNGNCPGKKNKKLIPGTLRISPSTAAGENQSRAPSGLKEMLSYYIVENKDAHKNAETIAGYLGVTKEHFYKKFKKLFGIDFKHYCYAVKINQARELLQNTSMKISRIIQECGFDDRRKFYYWFNAITGRKPKNFRK